MYADVIAQMAGDRTFTIHPRKGTDIILDKKVGKYIRTTEVKSPITVLGKGRKLSTAERIKMIKFALSHENTSKGIAVIHTVDKNMIVGPDVQEIPDREDVTTDRETTERILREQMQVAEKIKPSDVIAYFAGVRAPTYEEDFQVRKGIFCKDVYKRQALNCLIFMKGLRLKKASNLWPTLLYSGIRHGHWKIRMSMPLWIRFLQNLKKWALN